MNTAARGDELNFRTMLSSILLSSPTLFFFSRVNKASETLAVEKQARLRAETKEEDERRERISTTAQTAAIQQQHSKQVEAERVARVTLETETRILSQVCVCHHRQLS